VALTVQYTYAQWITSKNLHTRLIINQNCLAVTACLRGAALWTKYSASRLRTMLQLKYCNHKMFLVMLTSKYHSITAMLLVLTYVAKTSLGHCCAQLSPWNGFNVQWNSCVNACTPIGVRPTVWFSYTVMFSCLFLSIYSVSHVAFLYTYCVCFCSMDPCGTK